MWAVSEGEDFDAHVDKQTHSIRRMRTHCTQYSVCSAYWQHSLCYDTFNKTIFVLFIFGEYKSQDSCLQVKISKCLPMHWHSVNKHFIYLRIIWHFHDWEKVFELIISCQLDGLLKLVRKKLDKKRRKSTNQTISCRNHSWRVSTIVILSCLFSFKWRLHIFRKEIVVDEPKLMIQLESKVYFVDEIRLKCTN